MIGTDVFLKGLLHLGQFASYLKKFVDGSNINYYDVQSGSATELELDDENYEYCSLTIESFCNSSPLFGGGTMTDLEYSAPYKMTGSLKIYLLGYWSLLSDIHLFMHTSQKD